MNAIAVAISSIMPSKPSAEIRDDTVLPPLLRRRLVQIAVTLAVFVVTIIGIVVWIVA